MPLAVSVWREGELPVKNGGHHRMGGFFLRPAPPWGFFLGLPKGPGKKSGLLRSPVDSILGLGRLTAYLLSAGYYSVVNSITEYYRFF